MSASLGPILRKKHDPVNHPSHYTQGGIECIDAIEAMLTPEQFIGFLRGTAARYQWRLGLKDAPQQELGKANWYLARLKATIEKHEKKGVARG